MGRTRAATASVLWLALGGALPALAAPATPPPPAAFFNDYAGLVSGGDAQRLNGKLKRFADETSTQIVVAVFERLPEDDALEDFTSRTAQAWRVGQKKLDNGAVLFVFVKDRKLRIEVGYGLEGVLTDALSSRIIREAIVPAFRAGNWTAGIEAGADAMMAASRGEYTAAPRAKAAGLAAILPLLIFLIILIVFISLASRGGGGGGVMRPPYSGRTYSRRGSNPWIVLGSPGGGGSWGGGGWGGGGGGGGGFSGGGGSFGGGGASGSW